MYIGQYFFYELKDAWLKHTLRGCLLYTSDTENRLKPVVDEWGEHKAVSVMNVIGTFAPKSINFPEMRYCTINIIDNSYWLVSAEC